VEIYCSSLKKDKYLPQILVNVTQAVPMSEVFENMQKDKTGRKKNLCPSTYISLRRSKRWFAC
jgi:hypothetical protein